MDTSYDLEKKTIAVIYGKIDQSGIYSWPSLPDANAYVPGQPVVKAVGDGRFYAKPGDWLQINGVWYRYVGTADQVVYGPDNKKERKYWEKT